jgi:hypothetical protein
VALQTVPAEWTARGNTGAHHGKLHHFYELILSRLGSESGDTTRTTDRATRARDQKIKRASGLFRIQDARAALPQNCSIRNVRLSEKSENGTRVPTGVTKVPARKPMITKVKR